MSNVLSIWAQTPIQLTESLSDAVWSGAGKMAIPGGFLLVKNDAHFLYAALDLTEDTGNDPSTGDYFWFTFDRDRNGNINPNYDVNYGLYPGQPEKMGRQYYLGPNAWTGLLNEVSQSKCKIAFESSPNLATNHRVWKIRFDLNDLNVSLIPFFFAPQLKFGIKVHSTSPAFDHDTPANFSSSFSALNTLYLSRKPVVTPTLQGPVMGTVGLIPTTKINAAGRATTDPGYYIEVQNAAFGGLLNVIGNRTTLQNLWTAGARKYKVLHRQGTSGSFSEYRSAWYNYRWNGTDYELDSYGADSGNYYTFPNPAVDYSIDDLLLQFDSNNLTKGQHQFQVAFYNASNLVVPATAQTLTLFIDNEIPVVKINSIKHGGVNVDACAIVNMTSATDGLVFNIDAFDADGDLLSWGLSAAWGNNNAEVIASDSYTIAKGTTWTGVQNLTIPATGVWVPDASCAYGFTVSAYARTTNGYSYIGYNQVSKYLTIIKPAGIPISAERILMPKGIAV